MALYTAPPGYEFDQNTGLYYTQVLAEDADGKRSQVVTWFDADTGSYSQNVYPVSEAGYGDQAEEIPDGYIGKAAGFSRNAPVREYDSRNGLQEKFEERASAVGRDAAEKVSAFGQGVAGKMSAFGQDAAEKAGGWIRKLQEAQQDEDALYYLDDSYDEEDYYAYTAYDKNGEPMPVGIIRRPLYAVKRFINRCPLWMKFIPLAVLMLIDIILVIIKPEAVSEVRCSVLLGFIAIPFTIIHLTDLKRKYEAKALMIVQPVLLVVIGLLMMPSVIAVSFGIMKDIWLKPGAGPVFLWYLCVALGYALTYFMVRKRFQKISLPEAELWITVILIGMASMWVGVLAMWILALVIFVITIVVIVPLMLKFALSNDNVVYRDRSGRLYDEFGNRIS